MWFCSATTLLFRGLFEDFLCAPPQQLTNDSDELERRLFIAHRVALSGNTHSVRTAKLMYRNTPRDPELPYRETAGLFRKLTRTRSLAEHHYN
jgi:hypothetical protein